MPSASTTTSLWFPGAHTKACGILAVLTVGGVTLTGFGTKALAFVGVVELGIAGTEEMTVACLKGVLGGEGDVAATVATADF